MADVADDPLEAFRQTWTVGDYPAVGDLWRSVGEGLIDEIDGLVGLAGRDLTDVATGHGTTSLAAARRGAIVTGVDLTPKLLAEAQARADAEGLAVTLIEGDFHDLPVSEDSADVVTSTFGIFLSEEPGRVAFELARIVRPGGLVAITAWAKGSAFDDMRAAVVHQLPGYDEVLAARPDFSTWSRPDGVAAHIAGTGLALEDLVLETVLLDLGEPAAAVAFLAAAAGPFVNTRTAVEQAGGDWAAVEAFVAEQWANRMVTGDDGRPRLPLQYGRALMRPAA